MYFHECATARQILEELKELEKSGSSNLDLPFILSHNPGESVCDEFGIRLNPANKGFPSMCMEYGEHTGKRIERIERYVPKQIERGYAVINVKDGNALERVFVSAWRADKFAEKRNAELGEGSVKVIVCDINQDIGCEETHEKIMKGIR